jgi:hypothetical protein
VLDGELVAFNEQREPLELQKRAGGGPCLCGGPLSAGLRKTAMYASQVLDDVYLPEAVATLVRE